MVSLCLIVALLIMCTVSAYADEENQMELYEKNEYDILMELQNASATELTSMGYTKAEIEEIKDISLEEALLERAKLSEEELYKKGYNAYQIELLKSYDGSPIEANSEMRGVFADVTGTVKKMSATKSTAKAKFSWTWSNEPVLAGTPITEVVTCAFLGINTNNQECIITSGSLFCNVDYYDGSLRIPEDKDGPDPTPTETTLYSQVTVKFPMGKVYGGSSYWAKSGYITVEVKEQAVVNKLHTTAFLFEYGHPSLQLSQPSIDLSLSLDGKMNITMKQSITPGLGIMYQQGIKIHRDGSSELFQAKLS